MKKYNKIILFIIGFLFFVSPVYAESNKTIFIMLDDWNFQEVESTVDNFYGLGLINIKGRSPSTEEGLFLSINAGRKLKVVDKIEGIKKVDKSLKIDGYKDYLENIRDKNENIDLEFMGDRLKTGFIGDDSRILLATDKDGKVDRGYNYIEYNLDWLRPKTEEILEETDLLVLAFNIEDQNYRRTLLKNYIDTFNDYNIMVMGQEISKDSGHSMNKNLSPMVYLNSNQKGILKSKSTNRDGFVTIEDISKEIVKNHQLEKGNIGNKIDFIRNDKPLEESRAIFDLNYNLLLIAIIFQTIAYVNQGLTFYESLERKHIFNINFINKFIFVNIFVALILGYFSITENLWLYLFVNIGLTLALTRKRYRVKDFMGFISTLIYILMVVGIVIRPESIYNTYFGFNNLFYGARFYGFNNGAMGIFLGSSILSYFYIRENIKGEKLKLVLTFIYFGLNILILSARYGANTGGFITAVVLFLLMVSKELFKNKSNIKRIVILCLIGLGIFAVNMYFDSKSLNQSHAIVFLNRIRLNGGRELLNMVRIKFRELMKYTFVPPFIVIMLLQMGTLKIMYSRLDEKDRLKTKVLFITSLVAYIINDTGMIAFAFINQFAIANIILNKSYYKK